MIFLHLSDLNVRSAGNKAMTINSFTVDNDIDVLALTEKWFHDDNYNVVNMNTLSATGYTCTPADSFTMQELCGRDGGVSVLLKDRVQINNTMCDTRETFELMDVRFRSSLHLSVFVIYCNWPP